MKTSDFPVWLAIPYELREEARKDAGRLADGRSAIEWDKEDKLFFARPGCDLEKLAKWLPDRSRRAGGGDPQQEFLDVLTEAGLKVQGLPVMNGKRQRVATVEDKSGKKSGVYCGFEDRRPAGWFINYHRAPNDKEVTTWKSSGGEADPDTRLHLRAAARQSQDEAERERAQTHAMNTAAAKRLYERLPAVDPEHPYLVRKGITPTAELRQTNNGSMVVPFFNVAGEFKTLQYIPATGDKFLFKDAPKQGNYLVVGGQLSDGEPILYAEGYATARSLNMATGHPVVMTVDAGNMHSVSAVMHANYPMSPHLFLADFDHAKAENKGLVTATLSAERVGGVVVYPDFTAEEKALGLTDFNDLHQSRGLDAVLSQVSPALNKMIKDLPMQDDLEPGVTPNLPLDKPDAPDDAAPTAATEAKKSRGTRAAPAKPAGAKAAAVPAKKPRTPRAKPAAPAEAKIESPVPAGAGNSQSAEPSATAAVSTTATQDPGERTADVAGPINASAQVAPSAPETPIPFTTVQPESPDGELTPYERNQLRNHGWTDDQLTDIPADQARSALASYTSDPEGSPASLPKTDAEIEPAEPVEPVVAPVVPKPATVVEDASALPPEMPLNQLRQPEAGADEPVAEGQAVVDSIVGVRRGVDEVQPQLGLIDKDALLQRLEPVVQEDKSVLYKLDGEPAFIDRGMRLEMAEGASQSDEKVLAALLTAAEFYRGRIELTGSEAFQSKAIGLIAKYQPNVTMKNPAQQMLLVEARKALQNAPEVKDAIHGESPPVAPDQPNQPAASSAAAPAANAPVVDQAAPNQPADATSSMAQPIGASSDTQQPALQTSLAPVRHEVALSVENAPTAEAGPARKIASEIHEPHTSAAEGVVGKVLAAGNAPFRFDEDNKESTYIKLRTQKGVQTYWGKELAGLLRDTRIKPGNVVTLQYMGQTDVVVQVPIKDDQGVIKRYEPKDAKRNQWSLSVMGGATVRTGQDEGVKLAAYDANRFAHVQQALLAQLRLDLPLPKTPGDGLFWMTPDGQGSIKTGDALSTPRPPEDNRFAAQPVMSSWSVDGHLDMALVRGDGPYLQGVVRQNGHFQHVLVSLPGKDDAPPMVFNALTANGLVPIGTGNGINQSGGQAVSREHIAFKIDGDSAVRIGKLDKPAEVPPALHARLGFDERWRDDNTLPKSAPAAAPTAQPSEPRPA